MRFKQGLISARSHLIFLAGLVVAFGLVIMLERWDVTTADPAALFAGTTAETTVAEVANTPPFQLTTPRPLTAEEQLWAEIAWQYFAANTRPETGLADSVAGFPATTMWDTGSFLLGMIAAERLGVLETTEFDRRIAQALVSLAALPLFDDRLPNKSYDTRSLAMTDYQGEPSDLGIGWSAIDIGRIIVPLSIVARSYPGHAPAVAAVLDRWRLDEVVVGGQLFGLTVTGDLATDAPLALQQEGRVGYEEYAALGFALLGFDTVDALMIENTVLWLDVEGVMVPTDRRDHEEFGAHMLTLSEPYMLRLMEFGGGALAHDLAARVFAAQEARYAREGMVTAVSEDHIDGPPYFVYNAVVANGRPWHAITESGADATAFRSLSTKAALAWASIYATPYAATLNEAVVDLFDPEAGWYAGRFEASGLINEAVTANTNGVVLQSLHHRRFGPLLHPMTEVLPAAGQAAPSGG